MADRIVEGDCYCINLELARRAAGIIRQGGVVVAPTDTLYGLIADPFNPVAVSKVYRIKKRPYGKPLPLLIAESHHAYKVVSPSPRFWELALRHWPGPLTIVEEPAPGLPDHLAAWGPIGIRLPDCPLLRYIARLVGGVVIGTSANLSGRDPPVTVYEAYSQLGDQVDLYIDAGPTRIGEPSTVVSIVDGVLEIYREGAIRESELL